MQGKYISSNDEVDCEYLQSRKKKIRDKVPNPFCINESNITKMKSLINVILVSIGKKQWELMDEKQMEWNGDNGIGIGIW